MRQEVKPIEVLSKAIRFSRGNDVDGARKLLDEVEIYDSHSHITDARATLLSMVGTDEEKKQFVHSLYDDGKETNALILAQNWGIEELRERHYGTLSDVLVFRNRFGKIQEVLDEKLTKLRDENNVEARGYYSHMHGLLRAATHLHDNYDFSVPLTSGGIYAGLIFDLFGLPLVPAKAKRRGRGAQFKWLDSPEVLEGKRVIVMDDDVVTGRTLRRVATEIQKHSPQQLDVFLVHGAGYSDFDNVPDSFGNVYNSKSFDKADCLKIYQMLKQLPE